MKILLISDVHSNIDALRAVWERESDSDRILCAGDLTDWGFFPHEVIAWFREHNVLSVAGNHDRGLVQLADAGVRPASRRLARTPAEWNMAVTTEADIDYLRRLPEELTLTLDGITYYITHTIREDDMHLLKKELIRHRLLPVFDALWNERTSIGQEDTPRRMVCGHSHQCCLSLVSRNAMVLNPGSLSYRVCEDAAATGADYMVIQDGEVLVRHVDYPTAHIRTLIDEAAFDVETRRVLGVYYTSALDEKGGKPHG